MNKPELNQCLQALAHVAGIPLRILDEKGHAIMRTAPECAACQYFQAHFASAQGCLELGRMAASRARDIGETYVFSCPLGLCNAVRTLAGEEKLAVMAGSFLLEELDTLFIQELVDRYPLPLPVILEVFDKAAAVPVLSPADASANPSRRIRAAASCPPTPAKRSRS